MNSWPTALMDIAFILILFVTVAHIGNLLIEGIWNNRVYEKERLKRRLYLKRRKGYYRGEREEVDNSNGSRNEVS